MRRFHFLDFFFTKGFYFLLGTWLLVFSICQFIWKQCVESRSKQEQAGAGDRVRNCDQKDWNTNENVLEYIQTLREYRKD
jgi:hypothetical protein